MKDIKAILAEHGEGLTDDAVKAITDAVNANYKTINEYQKKTDRITQLETQNVELTEQVGNLKGDSEEVEKLRSQVESYKQADKDRKAQEEAQAKRDQFKQVFDAAVGDRTFANDLVKESVFERVYKTCSEDTGAGAKDTLEKLTNDMPGVWENPQTAPHKMPKAADISTNNNDSAAAAKKSLLSQLFQ